MAYLSGSIQKLYFVTGAVYTFKTVIVFYSFNITFNIKPFSLITRKGIEIKQLMDYF